MTFCEGVVFGELCVVGAAVIVAALMGSRRVAACLVLLTIAVTALYLVPHREHLKRALREVDWR